MFSALPIVELVDIEADLPAPEPTEFFSNVNEYITNSLTPYIDATLLQSIKNQIQQFKLDLQEKLDSGRITTENINKIQTALLSLLQSLNPVLPPITPSEISRHHDRFTEACACLGHTRLTGKAIENRLVAGLFTAASLGLLCAFFSPQSGCQKTRGHVFITLLTMVLVASAYCLMIAKEHLKYIHDSESTLSPNALVIINTVHNAFTQYSQHTFEYFSLQKNAAVKPKNLFEVGQKLYAIRFVEYETLSQEKISAVFLEFLTEKPGNIHRLNDLFIDRLLECTPNSKDSLPVKAFLPEDITGSKAFMQGAMRMAINQFNDLNSNISFERNVN